MSADLQPPTLWWEAFFIGFKNAMIRRKVAPAVLARFVCQRAKWENFLGTRPQERTTDCEIDYFYTVFPQPNGIDLAPSSAGSAAILQWE